VQNTYSRSMLEGVTVA